MQARNKFLSLLVGLAMVLSGCQATAQKLTKVEQVKQQGVIGIAAEDPRQGQSWTKLSGCAFVIPICATWQSIL